MAEEEKKSGIFRQIFMAVAIALLAGGTAPWWWHEFFGNSKPNDSATSHKLADLTQDELVQRQEGLEEQLHRMNELQQKRETAPSGQQFNISGTWQGIQGISYIIYQNGNAITIQEINPLYGVTAVGQGTIAQQDINISYSTAAFTSGQARLRLSDDGRQIVGTFTDLTTGMQMPASLSR